MKERNREGGIANYAEVAPLAPIKLEPEMLFRALADATRLRLVALLSERGELCVCELTEALGLSQPKVSRHLAYLRESNVVLDRRAGAWVHYRIHPHLPEWAREVIRLTAEGVEELAPPIDPCGCG